MAKNTENKKCIHCLQIPQEITFDHVIPKSWYSKIASKDARKPKAPACFECNQKLGRQEKFLSHIMWMCMPETHPLREELTEKVYRACGMGRDGKPIPELSSKERGERMKYAKRLLASTRPGDDIEEKNLFPGFGFHAGYPKRIQRATLIPENLVTEVASKVVRGIEYIQKGSERYVEAPYRLDVFFPRNTTDSSFQEIRAKCRIFSDGTNTIQRGSDPEKPLEPIYIIRLWNQWEIWGVIMHEERYNKL